MISFLLTLLTGVSLSTAPQPLSVTITDYKNRQAMLFVAVFDEDDGFPKPKNTAKGYRLPPGGKPSATLTISDLPFGTYAIAVFQDLNGNGKLDTGLMGIPKEPYCFSNNFRPRFSGPKWADSRFTYSAEKNALTLRMLNN
jgi:uncharacterized protein (DUF2141 family)